ncbi:protein PTHB1-like [Ctenocephalides felis]|uniref:protein PTHB1-like n=1 Tax=Ctenocephalides felis TaxID=7515 RepID=UPI000E6E1B4E|nr:protein PTHB1-like [Ctenocephalides felis]
MSLFKARSWWNTNVSEDETESFDRNSLLIARLTEGDHDNLVVGSHLGALRVYKVTTKRLDDGSLSAYKPTDLVLEKLLPYPVLGLGLGKLVSYVDSLRSVLFALNSLLFSLHCLVLKGISKMVLMCTASTTSYCILFKIIRRDHRPW